MSEINEINIPNVVIPKFGTNEVWLNGIPFVPSNHAPVSLQIGFPIVDMPGCVEMHKDNKDPTPPDTSDVGVEEKETPCPAPNQPRVGDLTQKGDERVIGHEIQNNQCVVLYEPTTAVEKYLPSTNQATTTAAIAIVATASAAATPLLLRIFKPVITKLWKTLQKKLGKKIEPPTRSEIQTNEYRKKKGLPPIKKKN